MLVLDRAEITRNTAFFHASDVEFGLDSPCESSATHDSPPPSRPDVTGEFLELGD